MTATTALPESGDVEILSDETVWDGRTQLQVVGFRHRRFDGAWSGKRVWELWRRGRAAAVLPYDPVQDRVVMIRQFRFPAFAAGVDPVLMELAAGLCDGDETPEATILRESREEMGIEVDRLERIGGFLLTPGGCDEHCTLFAGRVQLDRLPEWFGHGGLASEEEDIEVLILPADEAIAAAVAGAYSNAVATIGLLWLAARRDHLRELWA